ncbi:phosphoribosyltransferase [Carbonactinospora thermoautotrophica]|uniref:phosphoribosyltransferase family protein n=1 Tax=Carbonactinospora thermoautotrophica TaxID=1469144 RepID=UPI00226DE886|nr:phosphoribosyltransferase family protein [Carbonactinospora thermoautotrophica]MCX9193500.1 phosphoribosyltransferase [Carbonactinospora thermoautotrophica]
MTPLHFIGVPARARRVFDHAGPWQLTSALYTTALGLLTDAVRAGTPITAVIGIAEGGMALARDLAAALAVPLHRVAARHNPTAAIYTQATGEVACDLSGVPGRLAGRVLLVDDICGTGATVTTVADALAPRLTADARLSVLALCRNTGSAVLPDWWIWDVSDWVCFPWEQPPPRGQARPLPVPREVRTP